MSPFLRRIVAVLSTMVAGATACHAGSPSRAQGHPPLSLEKVIRIPGVPTGPYADSITVDVAGGRAFATPQAAKAVAVLDLREGKVLRMIDGFQQLHGVLYDPESHRLFVSDGKGSDLKVFDGGDYSLVKSIPLARGGDAVEYSARNHALYVVNGGEDAGMEHALISEIDPIGLTKTADIAISGTGLEGVVIDDENQRLYVAIYNALAVAVVDLAVRRQVATWRLPPGDYAPHGLALDAKRHRLYVTSRDNLTTRERPVGTLFVLDTDTGKTVRTLPIGGWADEVFFDSKRQRIYVISGAGWINAFHIEKGDTYSRLPDVETALISKHGAYVPEIDRLFVDIPSLALTDAQVLVFKPEP